MKTFEILFNLISILAALLIVFQDLKRKKTQKALRKFVINPEVQKIGIFIKRFYNYVCFPISGLGVVVISGGAALSVFLRTESLFDFFFSLFITSMLGLVSVFSFYKAIN